MLHATFSLGGQQFMSLDSNIEHDFTFTPAMSLFVHCETLDEISNSFAKLGEGEQVLMPPDNYGLIEESAWIADRFGVTWQLNFG